MLTGTQIITCEAALVDVAKSTQSMERAVAAALCRVAWQVRERVEGAQASCRRGAKRALQVS